MTTLTWFVRGLLLLVLLFGVAVLSLVVAAMARELRAHFAKSETPPSTADISHVRVVNRARD